MASLQVVRGANQGTSVPLDDDKIVLGRNADCQIVINLPAVSREHAMIRRIQGRFYIEDLNSRNGTQVNNQDVKARTQLQDNDRIKICDSVFAFTDAAPRPPLPPEFRRFLDADAVEEEESSSTVEATLTPSSKRILETQPAEKLTFLLDLTAELTQTFDMDRILPKIVDNLFQVFKQADRIFIIFREEGGDKLVPKVIRTRRPHEETTARFSRKIVNRCLENAEALLSEDASADKRFDLSQSIADYRIRSVMCAPLTMRGTGRAFGVIQLDTQDRHKRFTSDDLKLLLAVAGQAAIALESAKLHETMLERAGLERELELAHRVQLGFLPKHLPQVEGYEFFAHYESALEVGGDYYDFIPLPASRWGIMLGDVAGKGVPAALLMAKISSEARFCMLTEPDLARAVSRLNTLMHEAQLVDRFVTLSAALLDTVAHEVTFVSAGHLPPLIYRQNAGTIEEVMPRDVAGYPLGVAAEVNYQAYPLVLEDGDSVIVFSDGVTEAKSKRDVEFRVEGIRSVIQSGPVAPAAVGERLVQAVKKHALGCKQHDDLSIVCFGRGSRVSA
jgi:sigma-B regulation protein RsbU (phosphoserine phosphatase)